MDENLFAFIWTGLLAVIVLLLVAVIGRLGRMERALKAAAPVEESSPAPEESSVTPEESSAASEEPDAAPDLEAEAAHETWTEDEPTLAASAADAVDTEEPPTPPGAQAPYEEDGRWWFRRGGELLVYDELTEQWVDPNAPTAVPAEPEPHVLDEAREWDRAAAEATQAPIPEPVSAPAPIAETLESGPEGSASHWKCPACGVINGSTATACRMCFAARP